MWLRPNRKNKAMAGKIYYEVRRHKIIWITNMKRHAEILSLALQFFNYLRNKKNIWKKLSASLFFLKKYKLFASEIIHYLFWNFPNMFPQCRKPYYFTEYYFNLTLRCNNFKMKRKTGIFIASVTQSQLHHTFGCIHHITASIFPLFFYIQYTKAHFSEKPSRTYHVQSTYILKC